MNYKVVRSFKDLKHDHVYKVGDVYPAKGKKTTKARVKELSTISNKHAQIYITESGE